jgi:competence CoiA-like predicted nuclease
MIENLDFETFLYISKNKYQIFVYDKINLKNLYNEEINNEDEVELNILSKFLDENIYKIEKNIKNFIRNIILIIEDNEVLDVGISLKKKNYEKDKHQEYLENSLREAKDVFRENYQDQIIMHMIVVDNENNFLFNNDYINDDYLFLEMNFISITNNFTFYFDKLLENYQINIKRYMSGSYIKSFFDMESTESIELFVMANRLNEGLNKNEVQLVSKSREKTGFFEKFFQLFS